MTKVKSTGEFFIYEMTNDLFKNLSSDDDNVYARQDVRQDHSDLAGIDSKDLSDEYRYECIRHNYQAYM